MFEALERIHLRPKPFEFYTASDLWTDEHTSQQMLSFHLDGESDVSSRNLPFIDRSVAWIAAEFDLSPDFRIADFGCGPGLYAVRLAKCGARVTGIDFSERSIAYAAEAAAREDLEITYLNLNYLEFETEQIFDLALLIMCDYCALSPDQRKALLGIFHSILKPGGAVLLDVYSLTAFAQREEAAIYELNLLDGFWSPNRYHGFLNTFKYGEEKVILDKYTIIEPERTREVYNWLQYFSPQDLERELAEGGFEVQARYADVAGAPFDSQASEFAVVARKI